MLKEETTSPYNPVQGVIVYKKGNAYYLETHEILRDGDKFLWQEGKPFDKKYLQELSMELGNSSFKPMEIRSTLPENVLFIRQSFFDTALAWYLPPHKRKLYFTKDLAIPAGEIKLPGLVFAVCDGELFVVAIKGTKKPTAKTKLFKAPFYNMHDTAEVCLGNTSEHKPKGILEDEMLRWERRFFGSYFSHFLDEKVVAKGTNLQLLYKRLMKTKAPFPEKELVPSRIGTLQKLLSKLKK